MIACLHWCVSSVSLHVIGGDHTQPVCRPQCLLVEHLQQRRADEAGRLQCATFTPNHTLCWLRHHQTTGRSSDQGNIYLLNSFTHSKMEVEEEKNVLPDRIQPGLSLLISSKSTDVTNNFNDGAVRFKCQKKPWQCDSECTTPRPWNQINIIMTFIKHI